MHKDNIIMHENNTSMHDNVNFAHGMVFLSQKCSLEIGLFTISCMEFSSMKLFLAKFSFSCMDISFSCKEMKLSCRKTCKNFMHEIFMPRFYHARKCSYGIRGWENTCGRYDVKTMYDLNCSKLSITWNRMFTQHSCCKHYREATLKHYK